MLVLGIDPGSITTGWALLKSSGNKIHYVASGILKFDKDTVFLNRLFEIKKKSEELIQDIKPDEIAFESLIFVKSPTALMKLAQTRGVIISSMLDRYHGSIFEYSPNLVKSTSVGHGHADKAGVKRFIDMMLGVREYQSHDETDAIAIAICHILNKGKIVEKKIAMKKTGLAGALAHKVRK